MPDIIDFSNIVNGLRQQPFNSNTANFLQNSFLKQFEDIITSFLIKGHDVQDFDDKLIVMWGAIITGIGETNDEGLLAFNGEFLRIDAQIGLPAPTGGNVFVYALDTTFDPSDPQLFSSGESFNVLQIKKVKIVEAAPGSGLADVVGDPNVLLLEDVLMGNLNVTLKANKAQVSFTNCTLTDANWEFVLNEEVQVRENDLGIVQLSGTARRINSSTTATSLNFLDLPLTSFRPLRVIRAGVTVIPNTGNEVALSMIVTDVTDNILVLNNGGQTINTSDVVVFNVWWYTS